MEATHYPASSDTKKSKSCGGPHRRLARYERETQPVILSTHFRFAKQRNARRQYKTLTRCVNPLGYDEMSYSRGSLVMPKHWLRFSVSSLLILLTIICLWLGIQTNQANMQRRVVEAVQKIGGEVSYDHQESSPNGSSPEEPGLLERILGVDYFHSVVQVRLPENAVGVDDILIDICRLPRIEKLMIAGDVTDAGAKHLGRCTNLEHLSACDTRITDQTLNLGRTPFSSIPRSGEHRHNQRGAQTPHATYGA